MNGLSVRFKKWLRPVLCAAGGLAATAGFVLPAHAQGAHYKVFLDLSYSGNVWQAEAANGIAALAHTPPYDKEVTFKEVISSTDVQHQISDLQSMIAAGANAILFYPVSGTGLNRVIEQGCKRHVLMFAYDSSVTAPCAYNVASLSQGYAPNSAQWIINQLGGKGTVVINHGVAGTALTEVMSRQLLHVFGEYPGIHILQFYGSWNDAISQEAMAKILAADPNVDAVWSKDGNWGVLQALMQHRPNRLAVMSGQSNNGYRLAMGDPTLQKKGLIGLSAGSGPADGPYAFKVMMEVLTGQLKPTGHNISYPMPWVPYDKIKVCTGDSFVNGCNVFPASKVPASFIDTSLDGTYLPELNLASVQTGAPVPGMTIQKLQPLRYEGSLPGVNCVNCKAPAGWLDPTFIKPTVAPK